MSERHAFVGVRGYPGDVRDGSESI